MTTTAGDMATLVLPLLLLAIAILIAARFARRIPTRLGIYRFHMLLYPAVVIFGFILWHLMGNFHEVDWWVNDGTLILELIFGAAEPLRQCLEESISPCPIGSRLFEMSLSYRILGAVLVTFSHSPAHPVTSQADRGS